ncbi:MAG: hypothetical protein B7X02_02530, partial [Rhodospirillales bacterium 12-54-5]
MNRLRNSTILSLSILALSACASIIEGSTDHINLTTNPPSSSSCQLTNSRGTVASYTPATVSIKKSKSDIDVVCTDPRNGARGQSKIVSDIEAWDFGNILVGGLIGMGVDWGTGAAYDYPDSAVVTLMQPAPQPAAYQSPAYPMGATPFYPSVQAPMAPAPAGVAPQPAYG